MFRLSVADLDSPSYFVATAAVELGYFKQEGVEVELLREFGAKTGPERLREGTVHFFGGPAYAATRAFPGWKGAKLLCALAQYSYWFLAVRADLNVKRGDLGALKGLRISSSMEWPVFGLRHLLAEAGFDLDRGDVRIVPAPPTVEGRWMGHAGVAAISQGLADGYWGNGMRVAIGEEHGVAKLHLDLRRGDGPPGARFYNFAALTTTERLIEEHPDAAAGAVRAIVKAQKALKADPSLSEAIAQRLFPAEEVPLIA
ncbi:MAG TPA: ABC transporter substrate-binding protein, partial [Xanthobacteraceae bacterium]|nr:ABC transporter substrate-binding protein [Xanthobacteraceae bacterium]